MKVIGFDLDHVELGVPSGHTRGEAWAGLSGNDRAPAAMGLEERRLPRVDPWGTPQGD